MRKRLFKAVALAMASCLAFSMLAGCGRKRERVKEEKEEMRIQDEDEEKDEEETFVTITGKDDSDRQYTLYEKFLGLDPEEEAAAVVDDGVYLGYADFEGDFEKRSFTLDSLTEALAENRLSPGENEVGVLFAYLSFEDKQTLALKFTNMNTDGVGDESYTIVFVSDEGGELHITYSVSAWSRNSVELSQNGYIYTSGSAGAGETIVDAGFIGPEGKYIGIYTASELYGEWIGMNINADTYWSVYTADDYPNICITEYDFDGDKKYTYNVMEDTQLSSADKEYLNRSADEGMELLEVEAFDHYMEERLASLGIDEEYVDNKMPVGWCSFADMTEGRVVKYYLSPETDTDYWNYSSQLGYQMNYETRLEDYMVTPNTVPELLSEDVPNIDMDFGSDRYEQDHNMTFIKEAVDPQRKGYFQIYVTDLYNTIIVTPDGKIVKNYISPIDFIYLTVPEIWVADYDNDGEAELGVWEYILHGTGFSQDTFYIVDKNSETGEWGAYLLSPKWYVNELDKHMAAIDDDNSVRILLDEQTVNEVDKGESSAPLDLRGAYLVEVTPYDSEIVVSDTPMFYSTDNPIGTPAGNFKMHIAYKGNGNWEYLGCDYAKAAF